MNYEMYEKILNLFDNCQSHGQPLKINIIQDLLKIFPFPQKFILDLLSDQSILSFSYLSNDKTTLYFQNNLSLCSIDQNQCGSCYSSSCEQLHICKNYILNKTCSQLKSIGKCSYSHSLSTKHNENILKKYDLSSQDEYILEFISHLTRLSNQSYLIVQSINGEYISDQLINQWLGQHKTLLIDKKFLNPFIVQLIFEDIEVASMMENLIKKTHSKTALIRENLLQNNYLISNNNQQEHDIDTEVELTNGRTSNIFDQTLKINDRNVNSNETSTDNSIRINFGRGRGRQQFNTTPNSPSLNNQSIQSITKPFSRRLASNDQSPLNTEKKFSFSNRLNSIKTEQIKTKSPPELIDHSDQFSSHNKIESINSFTKFFPLKIEQSNQNNSDQIISPETSKPQFVLRGYQPSLKETNSIKIKSQTPINYIYTKQFTNEQLCYLLGPGRQSIIEIGQYDILSYLPSGCCRLTNIDQGKYIEKQLYSILPDKLNIQLIKITNHLELISCSSAAEYIFQQNQIHYAIISESFKIQLNIEIIHAPISQHRQSPTASSSIDDQDYQQFSSDEKFHIDTTNSTIDVISGDISEIPVDMMICISTSNNLRESVLRRAGSTTQSEFKDRHQPNSALLLNGGSTAARKILFVPWQTEIGQVEAMKTQKSLSDLVKWCIDQAHQRNMKSISFPPIGTGQLGLDPGFVCEAMISAASERLHQYKMDVVFVIYSSNQTNNDDDECYQIFRIYLDSLCEQIISTKISTLRNNNERKMSKENERKNEFIQRDVQGKHLLTLSASGNMNQYHNSLIKSLEKLIYEKTYDLSLIESSLIDKVDLLIDLCLKYNIIPRIDLSRKELTLQGDRDSCFQCFFNFREGKKLFQYSYVLIQNGEKTDEKKFNSFISLKINEAAIVGQSNICIKDDDEMIFNIDLNKLQVEINQNKQSAFLVKKEFNLNSKIEIPSSLFMIHTIELKNSLYQSLECFHAFEQTMSMSDWQIERIDSIENYPLYIHFINNNKNEKTNLYYHGCSYSSVQSIIHYGLHSTNASNYGDQFINPLIGTICLTRDVLNSHLYGTRRSTDGKHYLFAVEIAKNNINNDFILLSNKETHLVLPKYLIVYQRRRNF